MQRQSQFGACVNLGSAWFRGLEALAAEVGPFGVRVRVVLPGRSLETRFADSARPYMAGMQDQAYAELVQNALAGMLDTTTPATRPVDVAEAVWRAVTDPACPMHLPAGADAVAWAESSSAT